MGPAQTVQVQLKLAIDPNAPRALQAIGREMNKTNKAFNKEMEEFISAQAKRFQQTQSRSQTIASVGGAFGFGGIAGSLNRTRGQAQVLDEAGFGRAAGMLSRAAPVVAGAQAMAGLAQFGANAAYDKYSTTAQIGRGFVRDFIPGGESIQRFTDSMSGRTAKMEQARIDAQIGVAAAQARNETQAYMLSFNPRQAGLEGTAAAYRGQSAILPSVFDRSTASGERQYREEQRLLPLRIAEAKAERDIVATKRQRQAAELESKNILEESVRLTEERRKLERELNKDENASGASREKILRSIETTNFALGGNYALQKQAAQQVVEARRAEETAKAEKDRATVRASLLGRADVLDMRADSSQQAARSLGSMSPLDRQFAVNAVELVKRYGTDALPPDIVSAANSVAPNTIGKLIEKTGANSKAFDRLRSIAPDDASGSPNTLRMLADQLRREAASEEFGIDKSFAAAMAGAGRDLGKVIAGVIVEEFAKAKSEIINQVRLGRNAS